MKTKTNLKNFFDPQSIAIIGASETEGKVGNAVAKNILNLGYQGEVFLVNPGHKELFGRKCYARLEEIEKKVDLTIVIVPAKLVFEVVEKGALKSNNFVIISAGFSETGEEGKLREQKLLKLAEERGLNILGPNCLGFIIPKNNLNASFASGMPEVGNIALISQSGALQVALMDIARRERMGFSHIVSIGNKMQIEESDLIEYLINDNDTKVIGMYLEGIKDGKKFMEAAVKASGRKPIVIIKAGKTEKAQRAINSHTGALAGSDLVMNKVFEKLGIMRADNLENFIDLLKLISLSKNPKQNKKVAIVTNAGGPGVLAVDAFLGKEIELAEFSEKTISELRKVLPEEASVGNPIDLLGDAQEDRYENVLSILDKENIGSILAILTPQDQTPVAEIAEKISQFRKKTKKVVVAVFVGGERIRRALEIFRLNSINNFSFPDQAVDALDKYYKWSLLQKEKVEISDAEISRSRQEKADSIIQGAKRAGRGALLFEEASRLMALYDIQCSVYQNIKLEEKSQLGFPVVLKVDSDKLLHKADKAGVILGIKSQEELNEALEKINHDFRGEQMIIQSMAKIQTELIVGFKRDPIFGPIAVFGLGGIYTEIFKAVDLLLGPMKLKEVEKSILQSKISFLFSGARGQKPYNLEEFSKIVLGIMNLAFENEAVRELDINPLLVYNDRKKGVAVDVKVIV